MTKERTKLERLILEHRNLNKAFVSPPVDKLIYHYTSLGVFWKCVDNNSMYARHVRFSNDAEEYALGKKLIEGFVKTKGLQMTREEDYYMICFCKKDDLLSQWRGYAEAGVSMGFDFSYGEFYLDHQEKKQKNSNFFAMTLLNNKEYRAVEKNYISENKSINFADDCFRYTVKGNTHTIYATPYKVSYTKANKMNKKLKSKLKNIINHSTDKNQKEYMLCNYIPYIKNKGFKEEAEYRLLFDLHLIGKMSRFEKEDIWGKKITYLDTESAIRLPNIEVMFCNANELKEDCKYIIIEKNIYENDCFKSFVSNLEDELKGQGIKIKMGSKEKCQIVVGNGRNQSGIAEIIEKLLEKCSINREKTKIKIWYQGHLPIRTIRVAPCKESSKIKESIELYNRGVYWLKYVDVLESSIPYREK